MLICANETIGFFESALRKGREMDIYSFIRSKEVAEHCRSIGKTWNTLEMAVIIDRSNRTIADKHATIADKHAAWTELIENYPDMPAMPNYHNVRFDSVHDMLAERIVYERLAIERFKTPENSWFKTPENNVFYTYRLETWDSDSQPFTTFEKAVADLKDAYTQSEAPHFRIGMTIADDGRNNGIDSSFDYNGELYDIHVWCNDEIHTKWFPVFPKRYGYPGGLMWHGFEFADLFFIDIPIPFKRGDILTSTESGTGRPDVFVLDEAYIIDNPEQYARCLRGEIGDGGDMGGNGLFVNEAGALYWDHTTDYDSFVPYEEELKGNDRLLYYVSLFVANKIGLPEILNMQCRIMAEHTLSSNFGLGTHDCYIPEHLIYENRNK